MLSPPPWICRTGSPLTSDLGGTGLWAFIMHLLPESEPGYRAACTLCVWWVCAFCVGVHTCMGRLHVPLQLGTRERPALRV